MSTWVEPTASGRYKAGWRLGRGPKQHRTFDFEWQAREWAESAERDALQAAADLRAVQSAARAVADVPAPIRRGRPLTLPEPLTSPTAASTIAPTIAPSAEATTRWASDTLAEYAQAWLDRQGHLKDKGRSGYQSAINFLDWCSAHPEAKLTKPLGSYPIAELDQDLIGDWIKDQRAENDEDGELVWGNRTINGRLALVRSVVRAAVLSHKIAADPTLGIKKLPEKAKRPHRELAADEIDRLLEAATARERIWLLLGLRAGLRWGEVFGLDAGHVLRTAEGVVVIDVRQVNEAATATIRTDSTKTGDDEDDFRTVPLPPAAGAEVWTYVEQVRRERGDSGLLFATSTGTPVLYRNWLRRSWVKLRKRAGLHRMRKPAPPQFHDLRHTYLTWLGRGGTSGVPLPLRDVMELAGHSKIETAQKYQHTSSVPEHAAMVARVFGPVLEQTPDPEPASAATGTRHLWLVKGGA